MSTVFDERMGSRLKAVVTATTDFEVAGLPRGEGAEAAVASVQWARQWANQAREDLAGAIARVSEEAGQLAAKTELVDRAVEVAIEEYAGFTPVFRVHFVPPRRADREALGPDVIQARQRWMATYIDVAPSRIAYRARTRIVAYFEMLKDALDQPVVVDALPSMPIDLTPFTGAVLALDEANAAYEAERQDDPEAYDALFAARTQAAEIYRGARDLLSGVLTVVGSPLTVRDFLLREVARRAPAELESTTEALDTEETDLRAPAPAPAGAPNESGESATE